MEAKPIEYKEPDFFIPESEKGAEWSANAVRFYTNAYFNRPFFELNANRGNLVDTYQTLCPIDDIIENWKYYLGDQQIGVNSALINGRSAKALYRAGLEINSLVNHKVGQLESVLQSSKPTAEALSKDAKSKKQFLKELVLMQFQEKELMEMLGLAGVILNPLPQELQLAAIDEFESKKEYNIKEFGELICERIATKLTAYNDVVNKYIECTRQCIVGGLVGLDLYVKNGILCVDLVPAHQNIWDNSKTDSFLRDKRVAGRIYYRLTAGEVIANWGDQLNEDEIAEIKRGSAQDMSNFLTIYNAPINGYNLWSYSNNGTQIEGYSAVKI